MTDALGIIVAAGAALGALVYIATWVRKAVRVVDKILDLTATTADHVDRELTPNSGSSMKDQQNQIPRDFARLERKVERLGEQLAVDREVSRAIRNELGLHVKQANSDRQKLADQGIDLAGPQEGTRT